MIEDKYSLNKISLRFNRQATEDDYREHIEGRTLTFCRIAWGMIIFFGTAFAFLDPMEFGLRSKTVTMVRIILLLFAAIILACTFNSRLRRYLYLSSSLFITSTGTFCIFLVYMSDPYSFTPYFTGLFFAFAGIFTTTGLGFKYSLISLILNLIIFETVIGAIIPVPLRLIIVYSFFLSGIIIIFAYISYMVELISRKNFAATGHLKDSLAKIKTLSGLLPICSNCKKIRDDRGYWNQIDEYLRDHSDVDFSHSLCPDCTTIFYPKLKISKRK